LLNSPALAWAAPIVLVVAFAILGIGFGFALMRSPSSLRRLAYASIVSPTLFVFLGVVLALLRSPVPDEWPWVIIWSALALVAWGQARRDAVEPVIDGVGRWRVAHGVGGALVLLYVLFHITNHLFGLIGPAAHATVNEHGQAHLSRPGYRTAARRVALLQIASGLRLAWRWSVRQADFYRTFQVTSGVYLSVFHPWPHEFGLHLCAALPRHTDRLGVRDWRTGRPAP
jgi:hypothetical protein